jgi:radical SAM protein with 4Fe4S-binding SPASM domain
MVNSLKNFFEIGIIKKSQKQKSLLFLDLKTVIDKEIKKNSQFHILLIIMISFEDIDKIDYHVRVLTVRSEIKQIDLNIIIPTQNNKRIALSDLIALVLRLYNEFFTRITVRIKGLPYCLFSEPEGMFLEHKIGKFIKKTECSFCKFNLSCMGLPAPYSSKEALKLLKPYFLPEEIAFEISNYKKSPLNTVTVKKIIDYAKKMRVSIIRFVLVGSVVRYDIYSLLKYAKDNNFQVRLDISRIVVKDFSSFVKKIKGFADYVITYVNSYDLHNRKKKIEFLLLKKINIKIIRAVTIINTVNLKDIEKIYRFVLRCKIDKWAINRDVYSKNINKEEFTKCIDKLVRIKLDTIKNGHRLKVHMVYPVPFCFYDPVKINYICTGARSVDGYERILIDFFGNIKPMHYFDKIIGDFRDIRNAWNNTFLDSIRKYSLLPAVCKKCFFLEKCKGGSRFCAFYTFGHFNAPDPMMDYANVKSFTETVKGE